MKKTLFKNLLIIIIVGILAGFVVIEARSIKQMQQQIDEQQTSLAEQKKIYVFDLNRAINGLTLIKELHKEFETKIMELDAEVNKAGEEIKKIKISKIDNEVADLYLTNLRDKRNKIIGDYQLAVQNVNNQINEILKSISKEVEAPIFNYNAVMVITPDVVDVTDMVVRTLQP